ncbi:hypothetical protein FIBSPDRAFT_949565 [Athelia psychrophila]|uniref:Uncharacterized protein n=1 Tax=Athelia psychrophila TaxID=1759441 RepID=A0A166PS72_9AGAM|nr:hypothetical protein FIBSPDRAFT_949565 [Fibularhizoctonia sp. CBS 109695]
MTPTKPYFGVSSIPWSPLVRRLLTRRWSHKPAGEGTQRTARRVVVLFVQRDANKLVVDRLEEVAKWLNSEHQHDADRARPARAQVGGHRADYQTSSIANLRDILGAPSGVLSAEDVKYLDEPYKSKAITSHP